MPQQEEQSTLSRRLLHRVGPAIVVACVVLGPGSILTSSKIGCQFGYQFVWLLVAAGVLMVGAIATAASIGVSLTKSPCSELADRIGRPVACMTGICVFLMAACFQFSNNLGVLAAMEPLWEMSSTWRAIILVGLNALLVGFLFSFKNLYKTIERLMILMVGLMLLGFVANLLFAQPSLFGFLKGLVPSLPPEIWGSFFPRLEAPAEGAKPVLIDKWLALQGLIATTFSIAGAFYQGYLVREKGWTRTGLGRGLVDPLVGTAILIGISMMIMATSAAVLHGRIAPEELKSIADVAVQLEPLFGDAAKWLFCVGLFAGAISSFLVNSMIGGTLLADGLGQDASIDSRWTKVYTVLVLTIGMMVALFTTDQDRVPLIIFAHAVTVLGGPLLAGALIYLATRRTTTGERVASTWMIAVMSVGAGVVVVLAARTLVSVYLKIS